MTSTEQTIDEKLGDYSYSYSYKEEYEEDMFQEEKNWKKLQEKEVRFQNKISKTSTQPIRIKSKRYKRFKQKFR